VSSLIGNFHIVQNQSFNQVLSVGLGCNVIRFLYVAFLSNPYYALPFELVQGITHAACFAACCSYISNVSKPELKASTQGVMQGLHNGIGKACGALLGGYMINAIGEYWNESVPPPLVKAY
jgi:predicted MFS family arabinose efflux permease